jgi:hypothetical protein
MALNRWRWPRQITAEGYARGVGESSLVPDIKEESSELAIPTGGRMGRIWAEYAAGCAGPRTQGMVQWLIRW